MSGLRIERTSSLEDGELHATAVSDIPLEESAVEVPPTGTVIDGRYEITGLLGQGGMGHVLSARHVTLGHRLAIKVLRREMTRDAEIVERFRREARAASAIGHAGIVAVKDFGTLASGASYFVMEHVEGALLSDELEREGHFSVERTLDVIRQMAHALGAAHAAGIVHRDVKTENVILTNFHGRSDHVKLLDFGIAKLDFASRLSGAHRVLGTPAYMSPEQARGQALDQRTDVYSLGVLFYELLAGALPFDDPRPLEVLRQQITVAAPSVLTLRPDVPEVIADVIARCLAKSADARPANMAALIELLASAGPPRVIERSFVGSVSLPSPLVSTPPPIARASVPLAWTPPEVPPHPSPPVAVPAQSKGRGAAVIALALVLLAVGVATLAAAVGIALRDRSAVGLRLVAPPPILPPPIPAPPLAAPPLPVAAPSIAAPPIAAPPIAAPPIAVPPSIAPSVSIPPRAHTPHAASPAQPPSVAAPTAAPPPEEHPTIRVIDPWQ